MLNSLRFRLPALFLAGIALAGLVTSLIALRLFQDYTRDVTLKELRQEARGLAQLYGESAVRALDEDKAAAVVRRREARGRDRGPPLRGRPRAVLSGHGQDSGLTRLTPVDVGVDLSGDRVVRSSSSRPVRTAPSWRSRTRCGSGVTRVASRSRT